MQTHCCLQEDRERSGWLQGMELSECGSKAGKTSKMNFKCPALQLGGWCVASGASHVKCEVTVRNQVEGCPGDSWVIKHLPLAQLTILGSWD